MRRVCYNGGKSRPVTVCEVFENIGLDFSAWHDAVAFCESRGWSVGSMQRGAPSAIFTDGAPVSKWSGLSEDDKDEAWGYIASADKRSGSAAIVRYIKE